MKKKLIEVALPLEAINKESAREKSIRHGHPSTLHLWWARRPLAACRAVLFASLVDDPSSLPDQFPTEADQDQERQRLFKLIEQLVLWENSNNRVVLDAAYQEILRSTNGSPPPVYDPFCGGGSIPLEAQRLGLDAHGSDLNPVAVLITKALIEIPPMFIAQPPVNPFAKAKLSGKGMWTGVRGLADDVRYYGRWMRDRAFERIGHLYPDVAVPNGQNGETATVIAWLWARTVICPNPACGARMPLVKSFQLSNKAKKVWVEPVIDHGRKTIEYTIASGEGKPSESPKISRGANFRCLVCREISPDQHIKDEGTAGRMSVQLMAIAAEGAKGRIYVAPDQDQITAVDTMHPPWLPEQELANDPRNLWCIPYGLKRFCDLFTNRQLVAMTTFADLIAEVFKQALVDGGSNEYATALSTYLAFAVDRSVDRSSTICSWDSSPKMEGLRNTFARQAIPMTWDFAEGSPFSNSSGNWLNNVEWVSKVLDSLTPGRPGFASQLDATAVQGRRMLFSTDPPYYDNIGYADLSDFFYVWLRRSLSFLYPELLSTLVAPKKQELVATPYRFGGSKDTAQRFFEQGFGKAFDHMRKSQLSGYPLTVYYAFKQAESENAQNGSSNTHASTGWETMLEGLINSGFQVTATWPMRSELSNRMLASGTNALASSIVLACRPRPESAPITTRKDFLGALKKELPLALRNLQKGNIAPVDLAQAAIGPGMGVFSKFNKVLETDGSSMRVRTALGLINQSLDEVLSELESEFDPDTRWALAWFEQYQFDEGLYGEAEVLATAKALSISHLAEAGILHSRSGKVRLLHRHELPEGWDPSTVGRLTVWEVTQHLIHSLDQKGEKETSNLKAKIGGMAEIARDLAYRLYTLCERKGWAEEAGYYNSLVVAWPSMVSEAFELT